MGVYVSKRTLIFKTKEFIEKSATVLSFCKSLPCLNNRRQVASHYLLLYSIYSNMLFWTKCMKRI